MHVAGVGCADQRRLDALHAELRTLTIGSGSSIPSVLVEFRDLAKTEMMCMYTVAERLDGWEISRIHQAGGRPDLGARFSKGMGSASTMFHHDTVRPPPSQRNRVVEATSWLDRHQPGTWESSKVFRDVLKPIGLHRHKQVRALICDGPSLLAWFGVLQLEPTTPLQNRLLASMIAPLRARLALEQQLEDGVPSTRALSVALEQLGVPAFLLGTRGRIHSSNAAGRALLDDRHREISAVLGDALARGSTDAIELVPVTERGVPGLVLALVRQDSIETRRAACVQACTTRWSLTPRQAQVLELAAKGLANATIAATLGIGERSIEHHMTAIFDCAGVDGRAALVAVVLTAV